MAKQSGLLKQLDAAFNRGVDAGEDMGKQLMVDLFAVALHREFGFGTDRTERIMQSVEALHQRYYRHIISTKDDECDVYRNELDTLLAESVPPDRYAPFEERYPEIKGVKY